jgi:hypothetical protein
MSSFKENGCKTKKIEKKLRLPSQHLLMKAIVKLASKVMKEKLMHLRWNFKNCYVNHIFFLLFSNYFYTSISSFYVDEDLPVNSSLGRLRILGKVELKILQLK